ncbi:MAG: hypothetical protein DRO67_00150 [Candidatus Asgardarchaeum californiense]|nr:MAG: hypothetical protein DRO67_00150 [Candidatus Asgardarchaeum californiense]
MAYKSVVKFIISGWVVAVLFWVAFIIGTIYYIDSGKFRKDITKTGIAVKQIVKDIKEAE